MPLLQRKPSGYGPNVIPIRPQLRSTKIMDRIRGGKPSIERSVTRMALKHPEIRESDGIFSGSVDISIHCPSYCRVLSLFAKWPMPSVECMGDDGPCPQSPPPSRIVESNTAGTGSNHNTAGPYWPLCQQLLECPKFHWLL